MFFHFNRMKVKSIGRNACKVVERCAFLSDGAAKSWTGKRTRSH